MAGRGQRSRRAAARAVDGVQVDVVRHLVVGMIVEMQLDLVALADADELARHLAAEGPEGIADAVGEPAFDSLHFEMHDHLGRVVAMDRRRHIRRVGENGVFLADDRIVEILFAGGRESGPREQDSRQRQRLTKIIALSSLLSEFPPCAAAQYLRLGYIAFTSVKQGQARLRRSEIIPKRRRPSARLSVAEPAP